MSKKKTENKDDYFVTTKDIVDVLDEKPDLLDQADGPKPQPKPQRSKKALVNKGRLKRWIGDLRSALTYLRFRLARALKQILFWFQYGKWPKRRLLFGIVGLGLVGLFMLWFAFSSDSPDSQGAESDEPESAVPEESQSPPPTIAQLRRQVKQNPKNAQARLLLGHALFAAGKRDRALRFYTKALELDVSVQDSQLVNNLLKSFGSKNQDRAARLIGKHKITDAKEGLRNHLRHKRRLVRTKALKTLAQLGKVSRSDRVGYYLLDLRAKDCAVRIRAVTQLGNLGDKKAIPAMQEAKQKDKDETPWYKSSCLGNTVQDAIEKIRGKKK